MKLNNKGWSFAEMLGLMAILILFLMIAIFFIIRLSSNLKEGLGISNNKIDESKYEKLENKLKASAINYYSSVYQGQDLPLTTKIDLTTIIDAGYSKKIYDPYEKSVCNGYVILTYTKENADYKFDPYINCDNYTTEGFEE